jgi:hypothetical protein
MGRKFQGEILQAGASDILMLIAQLTHRDKNCETVVITNKYIAVR